MPLLLGPKTLASASKYRYGVWVGNPRGTAHVPGYCIAEVMPNERGGIVRQCGRKAKLFCAAHDPARVAAKEFRLNEREDQRKREQDRIVREGNRLLRRLHARGIGESANVHYVLASAQKFSESGYTRFLEIPFDDVVTLLDMIDNERA